MRPLSRQRIFAAVVHALALLATSQPRKIKNVLRKSGVFSVAYQSAARNFNRP
jgi:hypothetical protein